jgi:hypothetical protein
MEDLKLFLDWVEGHKPGRKDEDEDEEDEDE